MQILVNNRLMKLAQTVEAELFEDRTKESNPPSRTDRNWKQRGSRVSLDSQSDSNSVASSKRRVSPSWTHSSIDLYEILNAKRNRVGDLRDKLNSWTVATLGKDVIPSGSATRTTKSVPRELIPRYQTPFSRDIKGMDSLKIFTPLRFTLYDGKLGPRSHISHARQMMALWNHLDELMCRVFPSSLGDLVLKWFDWLPTGSVENFHQKCKKDYLHLSSLVWPFFPFLVQLFKLAVSNKLSLFIYFVMNKNIVRIYHADRMHDV